MPGERVLHCVVLGALLACSRTPGDEAGSFAEPPSTPAPAETAQAVAGTTIERIAYVEGAFPHGAHAGVECSICHGAMPGHATHGATRCTECHVPPSEGLAVSATADECAACHHAADQSRPCTHCHAPAPAVLPVPTTFHIAGRTAAAGRSLDFEHVRHVAFECRTCHTGAVTLTVERDCASCHDDHHVSDSDCSVCHAPMPLRTHDVGAHRTCAGSECHAATPAFAVSGPRNVCLVCHREQFDHEPGGDCRTCHLVGGAGP